LSRLTPNRWWSARRRPVRDDRRKQGGRGPPPQILAVPKDEKLTITSTGSGATGWLDYYIGP